MGKNGGRPKKETIGFNEKETIGFENVKTKTKPNVNANVNVNENVNANVNAVEFYNNNINLLTPFEFEKLKDYSDMEEDLIIYAMQKAVMANKRRFDYIDGTLKNWKAKGIKTLVQAKNEEIEFKRNKLPKEESEEEKTARKIRELEESLNGSS